MQKAKEPTEIGQLLIEYLLQSTASRGTRALVFIRLKEDSRKLEMCNFLSKNPQATEAQILEKAQKIAG